MTVGDKETRAEFSGLVTRLGVLTEKWQIFSGRCLTYNKDKDSLLMIHFPLSDTRKHTSTDREDGDGTRLRLLAFRKSPRPSFFEREEVAPVSVFHPRKSTCITLNAFSKVYASEPEFEGTRGDYSKCRDVLLEDIRADTNAQLDAWQQMYLLACVRTQFHSFWHLKVPEGQDEPSDRSKGEPRVTDVVSDES